MSARQSLLKQNSYLPTSGSNAFISLSFRLAFVAAAPMGHRAETCWRVELVKSGRDMELICLIKCLTELAFGLQREFKEEVRACCRGRQVPTDCDCGGK